MAKNRKKRRMEQASGAPAPTPVVVKIEPPPPPPEPPAPPPPPPAKVEKIKRKKYVRPPRVKAPEITLAPVAVKTYAGRLLGKSVLVERSVDKSDDNSPDRFPAPRGTR